MSTGIVSSKQTSGSSHAYKNQKVYQNWGSSPPLESSSRHLATLHHVCSLHRDERPHKVSRETSTRISKQTLQCLDKMILWDEKTARCAPMTWLSAFKTPWFAFTSRLARSTICSKIVLRSLACGYRRGQSNRLPGSFQLVAYTCTVHIDSWFDLLLLGTLPEGRKS